MDDDSLFKGLDMQMLMITLLIIGNLLGLALLWDAKELQDTGKSLRSAEFMRKISIASVILVTISALYFAWLAYIQHEEVPTSRTLNWLFVASTLASVGSVVRLYILLSAQGDDESIIIEEEAVEG